MFKSEIVPTKNKTNKNTNNNLTPINQNMQSTGK